MSPITVLLSEDHTILRDGLRSLLADEPDIKIIGEAADGRRAVELCLEMQPDVVVMDIGMPLLNGLEASRQILKSRPHTRILILSASNDPAHLEEVMKLNVAGFVMKQSSATLLPTAIRAAHSGKTYYSPGIATRLERLVPRGGKPSQLTSREAEVLQLVAEGSANKQIAAELNISVKTVEKHRHCLMNKLNIHDTAGLTRYAIDRGVIQRGV